MSFKEYVKEAEGELFPTDEFIAKAVVDIWDAVQKIQGTEKIFANEQKIKEFKDLEFNTVKEFLKNNWPEIK